MANEKRTSEGKQAIPVNVVDFASSIIVSPASKITTPTHTTSSVGTASTVALVANANRLYALLINDCSESLYIKFGAAAVLNQGIRLNASGGAYEMAKPFGNLYTGTISAISTSGSMPLLVTEGV